MIFLLALAGCAGGGGRPEQASSDAGLRARDFGAEGTLDAGPGAAADMGMPLSCTAALECANGCVDRYMDSTLERHCELGCRQSARPASAVLFIALNACLDNACPSLKMGDVCSQRGAQTCTDCYRVSQTAPTGACSLQLAACLADLP